MARRAEVAGIINPTVDERQLEREAQDMGGRLEQAAQLTPSIDTGKIQRQLERAIPGGGILGTVADAVSGGGGGGAGGQQDGGVVPGGESTIQTAMLDKLDDIHDELEQIGAGGGLGGGQEGAGGPLQQVMQSPASGGFLGGALGGTGLSAAGGTAATVAGGTLAGGAIGLGAVAGLDRTGALGGIRGAGQRTRSAIGGDRVDSGLETLNNASFGGLGATVQGGATAIDIVRGNGLNGPMSQQAGRQFDRPGMFESGAFAAIPEPDWIQHLDTQFTAPEWLQGIDTEYTAPSWLQNIDTEYTAPQWLRDFDTTITAPDWLQNLDLQLDVPEPDWLGRLDSSLNLNIDFPTPQIDLATGSVQAEVEDAFDTFKDDIVGEVVRIVTDRLSPESPI